jgi:hypothetical protein
MNALVKFLLFAYCSGFIGGLLCGFVAGLLAAIVWGLVRRRKRKISARRFSRELDEWVEEIEAESVKVTSDE